MLPLPVSISSPASGRLRPGGSASSLRPPHRPPLICVLTVLVTVLSGALTGGPLAAKNKLQSEAEVRSEDGLVRVVFMVPEGSVEVLLPDDMAVGDTISGSVRVRASGQRKVEKNLARLGRMSLSAGGLRRPVEAALVGPMAVCRSTAEGQSVMSCEGGSTSPRLKVVLLDRRDRPLLEALIPVLAEAPETPDRYTYLPLGQAREPFQVRGAFDGDFFTTRISMGGQRLSPAAESPRRAVVWSPQTVLGDTVVEVQEGSRATLSGSMRNLAVLVRFAKPALQTGERTILELLIHGLEDLPAELPLEIVSLTPDAVRLERGPIQPLVIHPREVQGGGVYPWVGTLVGVSPQPFRLEVRPKGLRWRVLER